MRYSAFARSELKDLHQKSTGSRDALVGRLAICRVERPKAVEAIVVSTQGKPANKKPTTAQSKHLRLDDLLAPAPELSDALVANDVTFDLYKDAGCQPIVEVVESNEAIQIPQVHITSFVKYAAEKKSTTIGYFIGSSEKYLRIGISYECVRSTTLVVPLEQNVCDPSAYLERVFAAESKLVGVMKATAGSVIGYCILQRSDCSDAMLCDIGTGIQSRGHDSICCVCNELGDTSFKRRNERSAHVDADGSFPSIMQLWDEVAVTVLSKGARSKGTVDIEEHSVLAAPETIEQIIQAAVEEQAVVAQCSKPWRNIRNKIAFATTVQNALPLCDSGNKRKAEQGEFDDSALDLAISNLQDVLVAAEGYTHETLGEAFQRVEESILVNCAKEDARVNYTFRQQGWTWSREKGNFCFPTLPDLKELLIKLWVYKAPAGLQAAILIAGRCIGAEALGQAWRIDFASELRYSTCREYI